MFKHISSPLGSLSLISEKKKARQPANALHGEPTMVTGKLLLWLIICPQNVLYTVRLN